jgi:manganese/zinc/iron transport system ATP- binding protein
MVGIVGPNGSGKTTLLRCLLGLQAFTGSLNLPVVGDDLRRVAYVPQRASVDWDFPITVRAVVEQGRYVHRGLLGRLRPDDHAAVDSALAATGLSDLASRCIDELSGGQQQRMFIARAIAQQAALYGASIIALTRELVQAGATVVVVHHDLLSASRWFDWTVLLNGGQVVASGPVEAVMTVENLGRVFGHELVELLVSDARTRPTEGGAR